MRALVVGSGPAGMTAAVLLARQGHDVVVVDRDPGPVATGPWERVGVMQFHLPHGFRPRCRAVLAQRMPDVFEELLSAGVVDAGEMLHARRSTFERALWEATSRERGITRITGHVDRIEVIDGAATGAVVDGARVGADLVVDASGRAARLSDPFRPVGVTRDCGMAYAARQYALRPGAEPGPTTGGPGLVFEQQGFFCLLFLQDAGTFTVLFVRATEDRELAALRHTEAFESATRLLPEVAAWVDPGRSVAIDRVRAGAGLTNSYRPQPTAVRRLLAVGDAVCTTNPMGARGVSLGMESAVALADLVDGAPEEEWAGRLEAWCAANLECWYHDHVAADASIGNRLRGREVDVDAVIGWDVVAAAAGQRPELMAALGPYLAMSAPPASIDPLREEVRAMLRSGWRPSPPSGPTRVDLVAAIGTAGTAA